MLETLFSLLFFSAALVLLLLSARADWRGLILPNEYSLALIGVFILGAILPSSIFDGVHLVSGLVAGLIMFLVTIVFYATGAMGGGDTKLASATALLVGMQTLSLYLVIMAFTGGVLAVYAILTRRHGDKLLPRDPAPGTWLAKLQAGENKLPYGIAIATGGIVALLVQWLVPVFDKLT